MKLFCKIDVARLNQTDKILMIMQQSTMQWLRLLENFRVLTQLKSFVNEHKSLSAIELVVIKLFSHGSQDSSGSHTSDNPTSLNSVCLTSSRAPARRWPWCWWRCPTRSPCPRSRCWPASTGGSSTRRCTRSCCCTPEQIFFAGIQIFSPLLTISVVG